MKSKIKISFRNRIVATVFLIYIVFSVIMFTVYNNFFINNLKKDFISQNEYFTELAKETFEDMKSRSLRDTRSVAGDTAVAYMLNYGIIPQNDWQKRGAELVGTYKPAEKERNDLLIGAIRGRFYSSDEIGIKKTFQIFNRNLELKGESSSIPVELTDNGNEKYIKEAIEEAFLPFLDYKFFMEKNNKLLAKTIAPITVFENHKPKVLGVVSATELIDSVFIDGIKNKIGREVFLIKDETMVTSTLFKDFYRVENKKILKSKREIFKSFEYDEIVLDGKELGISIFPIYSEQQKSTYYIGIGFDLESVKKLYNESLTNFVRYEVLFSIFLFIAIYQILRGLFKPFNRIVERISEIKDGKYGKRVRFTQENIELAKLIESVNSLAEAVEIRENELKNVNQNLEKKIEIRTQEINEKNIELENAVKKLNSINGKMNADLQAAGTIMGKIIDYKIPKISCINGFLENISMRGIGGDYVDTLEISPGKKGILFGDIAGHGVAAALMVSVIKFISEKYLRGVESPAEALYILNDLIAENFPDGVTFSAVYIIIDEEQGTISLSSGAQEDVLIINENGVQVVKNKGIILGVLESSEIRNNFDISYKVTNIKLNINDKIFIYTDGLIEKEVMDRNLLLTILSDNRMVSGKGLFSFLKNNISPLIKRAEKDDATYLILEKSC